MKKVESLVGTKVYLLLFFALFLLAITPLLQASGQNDINGLIKQGKDFYENGEYGNAIMRFQEALSLGPTIQQKGDIHFLLALAYFANAQNDKMNEQLGFLFAVQPDRTIDAPMFPPEFAVAFNKRKREEAQKIYETRLEKENTKMEEDKLSSKSGIQEGNAKKIPRKYPKFEIDGGGGASIDYAELGFQIRLSYEIANHSRVGMKFLWGSNFFVIPNEQLPAWPATKSFNGLTYTLIFADTGNVKLDGSAISIFCSFEPGFWIFRFPLSLGLSLSFLGNSSRWGSYYSPDAPWEDVWEDVDEIVKGGTSLGYWASIGIKANIWKNFGLFIEAGGMEAKGFDTYALGGIFLGI